MTTITDMLADEIRVRADNCGVPLIRELGDTIASQLIEEILVEPGATTIGGRALLHANERLQVLIEECAARGTPVQAQFLANVLAVAGERLYHHAAPGWSDR